MAATKEQMIAAVAEYCRAETDKDKDAWLALFDQDVTHEDPVGSGHVNRGVPALAAGLWDAIVAFNVELWCEEPVITCGNEAVALMRCRSGPAGRQRESGRIVDHFVFGADGKITSVRAFYSS